MTVSEAWIWLKWVVKWAYFALMITFIFCSVSLALLLLFYAFMHLSEWIHSIATEWNWIHTYVPSHTHSNSESKQMMMMMILNWLLLRAVCALLCFALYLCFLFCFLLMLITLSCLLAARVYCSSSSFSLCGYYCYDHFVLYSTFAASAAAVAVAVVANIAFASAFSLTILILMVNYLVRSVWSVSLILGPRVHSHRLHFIRYDQFQIGSNSKWTYEYTTKKNSLQNRNFRYIF